MYPAAQRRVDSKLAEGLAGHCIQLTLQRGISRALAQLLSHSRADEPARASTVGDDVGYRLSAHSQRDALAGSHGINHLARAVAQVSHSDLHVRQCST